MRLTPVPIFYWKASTEAAKFSALSSKVTHASKECLESASIMGEMIALLLQGKDKREATLLTETARDLGCEKVKSICQGGYLQKTREQIKTTGYVVDTLEAALWCFHCTNSFEQGMMQLAGMGGDVDTVCCVFGQIAGAYYGYAAIPGRWKNSLQRPELIARVAMDLVEVSLGSEGGC